MTDQTLPSPPWTRTAGLIYVGTIVSGVFAQYIVRSAVIVRGDAVATAHNILANEALFRLGIVAELGGIFCYVAVTALFYDMFKPVNRRLSLIAAFFSLVGCAVGAANLLGDLMPLVLLQKDAPYLAAIPPEQLQALSYAFIRLGGQINTIGLLFFAVYCTLIGTLVLKSTFLPKAIGALMLMSGVSWMIGNAAIILTPPVGAQLSFLQFLGIAGEASITLWLLVMGVNVARWQGTARTKMAG
jgi:hypothetical protein